MSCVSIFTYIPTLPNNVAESGVYYFELENDFDIKESKFVEQLTELNKIKIDGVLGFNLPGGKNNIVLGKYKDPHYQNNSYLNVRVMISGKELNFYELYVVSYKRENDSYSCELKASEHWLSSLRNLKLNQINLSDGLKTVYAPLEVTSQNNLDEYTDGSKGVRYPVAYYGKFTYEGYGLHLQDFRPYVMVLWIIQKAFCQVGWKFRSSVLETNYGRNIMAYLLDKNFGFDANKLKDMRVNASRNSTINSSPLTQGQKINFNVITENPGGYFSGTEFTGAGIHDVYVMLPVKMRKEKISTGERKGTVTVSLIIETPNGVLFEIQKETKEYSFEVFANIDHYFIFQYELYDVQLDSGSKMYLTVNWTAEMNEYTIGIYDRTYYANNNKICQFSIKPKSAFLQEGDEFLIEDALRPDKFLDFFKGVIHLFKGKLTTDYLTREVHLLPSYDTNVFDDFAEGYFKDDLINDYTSIIENDTEVVLLPSKNQKRYINVKFKGDGDGSIKHFIGQEKTYGSYRVDLGDDYDDDEESDENPYFEAAYYGDIDGLDQYSGIPISMLIIGDYNSKDKKISTEISPRIVYWGGMLQQRKFLDNGEWPANHAWPTLFVMGVSMSYLPCAWTDPGETKFGTPPEKRIENVVYGEKLLNYDLYSMFWRRSHIEEKVNKVFDINLLVSSEMFRNANFREKASISILNKTVIGRIVKIDEFSHCANVSSRITIIPTKSGVEQCNTIPNSGNQNSLFCDGNAPSITVVLQGSCYMFGIGGSIVSPVDTVTYEYRYASSNVWVTASQLCNPEESFYIRMTVDFYDECRTITRIRYVDSCGNSPEFETTFNYALNCFGVSVVGQFSSDIDLIEIEWSLDGVAWNVYNNVCTNIPNDTLLVYLRATITYQGGCLPSEIEGQITIPLIPANCEEINANVICNDGDIQRTGDFVSAAAIDIIEYRFDTDEVWRIWDEETTITPCPYWIRRVIVFCNDSCPVFCSTPILCNCEECLQEFTITCLNRTLNVDTVVETIDWTGPGGFTATGNNVVFPNSTPSGTFTATITIANCIYVEEYIYTKPNAGTPVSNPIIV